MHIKAVLRDKETFEQNEGEKLVEDTIKIRKDKIKNIAIVFLSVMLVLTFFSNSILNRALPEVATAYVEYNTITERVRGTGTVEAMDPYTVVSKDTRTIESVAVSVGDMVTKDQVLFYLEDAESEELTAKEEEIKAKEEELSKQVLDYMTAILSVDISNAAYQNIQNDNIASVAAYQTRIEESRQKVEAAQSTVDSLNRQILVASMDSQDDIDRDTELAVATANRDNASKRMSDAQAQISSAQATITALGGSVSGNSTGSDASSLEGQVLDTAAKLSAAKSEYDGAYTTLTGVLPTPIDPNDTSKTVTDYFNADNLPKSVETLASLQTALTGTSAETAFTALREKYDAYIMAQNNKITADKNYADYNNAKSILASAQSALTNATNEYNAYQAKITSLTNANAESAGDNTELQNELKVSLSDAEAALEKVKKEQDQLLKDVSSELALSNQNEGIADTEKELAELQEELAEIQAETMDATIVSPVEGTIVSLSKTAGESTQPQEAVATIQVAGKGMTVSFSVTNAQAAKVTIGDKAELQNAWYYNDVMITLSKIKPDTEDPGKKKLLEFVVEGPVQSGESLTLSVGERSAEYEHVVPNSAIREDNKGKFIFIIEEKSTPFGNRYKAKRVDVEVLASDEINSAILAELEGHEYVITTSNQPVEAGDQVRING